MLVKICGITRVQDAQAAIEAGAGAIGFVFWPGSPRAIDPFRARKIALTLPPFITTVGVFVDQPAEYVSGVASLVRLGAVQLHGSETPAYAAALARPIIKAVSRGVNAPFDVGAWPRNVMVLLDAHDPVRRGGTGTTIDWDEAALVARRRPILLAGGLNSENVADAVERVRPFGIDVSSGVETSPGVKSHERITALFRALAAIKAVDAIDA